MQKQRTKSLRLRSNPFQGLTPQVLEINKIYQRILNYVTLSILKLEKRYLHQNGVEFHHEWESIQGCIQAKISIPPTKLKSY